MSPIPISVPISVPNPISVPSLTFQRFLSLENGSCVTFQGILVDLSTPQLYKNHTENGDNFSERWNGRIIEIPGRSAWTFYEKDGGQGSEYKRKREPERVLKDEMEMSTESDSFQPIGEQNENEIRIKRQMTVAHAYDEKDNKKHIVHEENAIVATFDDQQPKIGDVLEITGTLNGTYTNDDNEMSTQPRYKSTLLQVQVKTWKRVNLYESSSKISNMKMLKPEQSMNARKIVLKSLQTLLGSELAAELLLDTLVSRVHLRKHGTVVGKLTLNLMLPKTTDFTFGYRLQRLVQQIMPQCCHFEMSLNKLNGCRWMPFKNYDDDRLEDSCLQLANGTIALFNMLPLAAGELNNVGVKNLRAIARIINEQKLEYDFVYNQIDFDVDYVCIILSQGKSMLPADFRVVCHPTDDASLLTLTEEDCELIRAYIIASRNIDFAVDPEASEMVVEQLVLIQQRKSMSPAELHSIMNLVRLFFVSHMRTTVCMDIWDDCKSLMDRVLSQITVDAAQTLT